MLDQRHIDGFIVEELDDPLLTGNFNQCIGFSPTETAASAQHLSLDFVDRLLVTDLVDDLT